MVTTYGGFDSNVDLVPAFLHNLPEDGQNDQAVMNALNDFKCYHLDEFKKVNNQHVPKAVLSSEGVLARTRD